MRLPHPLTPAPTHPRPPAAVDEYYIKTRGGKRTLVRDLRLDAEEEEEVRQTIVQAYKFGFSDDYEPLQLARQVLEQGMAKEVRGGETGL